MTSLDLGSSSEDEDCVYLNPVAKLKALKQKELSSQINNNNNNNNNNIGNKKMKDVIETINPIETIHILDPIETREIINPTEIIEIIDSIDTMGRQKDQHDLVELVTEVGMRTRSRTLRERANKPTRRPRRQIPTRINYSEQLDSDSDVELVSAEDPEPDFLLIRENSVNKSFVEDENYEINIKVLWLSVYVHSIKIRRNEKCQKIFEYFATVERVPIDDIVITHNNKTIKKNDTPASIGLSIIDILEGGIVNRTDKTSQNGVEEDMDEDVCVIKIQTGTKKKLSIRVKRDESFKNLIEKCSKELGVDESKIKLLFDGDFISPTDTPNSLDIEDEACFDVRLP